MYPYSTKCPAQTIRPSSSRRAPLAVLAAVMVLFIIVSPGPLAAQTGQDWLGQAQGEYDLAGGQNLLASLKALKLPPGSPEAGDAALAAGIVLHNLARLDPPRYCEPALASLKPLAVVSPLAQAWYGSALTIRGGLAQTNKDLVGATAWTDEGLQTLDAAVTRDPASLAIRIIRVENNISVSRESPFKRWDTVKTDIAWLRQLDSTGKLPPAFRPRLALYAGEQALAAGKVTEALKQFDQAIKLGPKTAAGRTAAARLAELEE